MTSARWTPQQLADYRRKQSARKPDTSSLPTGEQPADQRQVPKPKKVNTPNMTEIDALEILNISHLSVKFEGRKFPICGGATYKPDWIDEQRQIAIEVKSEWIASRDSRRRFDEARTLYPDWRWIWIRKRTKGRKGPRWEVEVY